MEGLDGLGRWYKDYKEERGRQKVQMEKEDG